MPKNDEIWPKIGIFVHFAPGIAGSFGALLVGWLVVVAQALSRKTPIYFINIIREKDGVRTLCHETALRYMLIQGAAPFFGGGVVLKIYWARHTRVAFSWGRGRACVPAG